MRALYSITFYLSIPFILLHFAIRGLQDRAYLSRWKERFAFYAQALPAGGIVLHAASVGELKAAEPLIRALAAKTSTTPLLITTFTPTSSAQASSLLGENMSHFYAPLDLPGAVKRFFEHVQPKLLIIMETEIWPNLLFEANRRNIPVLMANARMSSKSFISYRRFGALTESALSSVDFVAAQSQRDLNRLVACGVKEDRIASTGNMKYDLQLPPELQDRAKALQQLWGKDRPVLIAGSTHTEDDVAVLAAFEKVLVDFPTALLILVPRHPERFQSAAEMSVSMGFSTEFFSNGEACSQSAQCFVIDAMGELQQYYCCSDIAVIGGSFGQTGGHNPLEASAAGVPVIVGPNTDNFDEITSELIEAGAAIRVSGSEQLESEIKSLFEQPSKGEEMGTKGKQIVLQGQGALQAVLTAVEKLKG
jgi:3-deoxy-D-manno-octulosonic-acid transferase